MKPEDKELLLKDLCARLPYGVHIWTNDKKHLKLRSIDQDGINGYWANDVYEIDEVKPYLRPMDSMTKEEKVEYGDRCYCTLNCIYKNQQYYFNQLFDWLNEHHFDYRDLISRGLAIKVTEENNPYESTSEIY